MAQLIGVANHQVLTRFAAQRVSELVGHGKLQPAIEWNAEFLQELLVAIDIRYEECLLQKDLALLEERKGGTGGVAADAPQDGLPIIGFHENPRPALERAHVEPRQQLLESGALREAHWVRLTSGDSWDDKPRWSSNGDILYFVSERDGFRCIWAQRLDLPSKRPLGAPFPVYHFHRAGLSMMNTPLSELGFAVARNRMVFTLREATGNIWITTLGNPR